MQDQSATDVVSKSQRKRDADALFELGRSLCHLSVAQLRLIELPGSIRDAVDKTRRINAHVAHKRELQYLAKLLRHIDTSPIVAGIEQALLHPTDRTKLQAFAQAADWKARLNMLLRTPGLPVPSSDANES